MVECDNHFGTPVDSAYYLAVTPSPKARDDYHNPASLAFAVADQRTAASYNGNANYDHNPGSTDSHTQSVRFTRSGAGVYRVVFENLDPLMLGGASAVVSPSFGNGRCTLGSVGNTGKDVFADVRCYNFGGVPSDVNYSVLMLPRPFQNLVQNASFETPVLLDGDFAVNSHWPGWQVDAGGFKVTRGGVPAYDGAQYLNLDSHLYGDGPIYQDLATVPGTTYRLSFEYRYPDGTTGSKLEWRWNLGAFLSNTGLNQTEWNLQTNDVTATGTTTRLEFKASATTGGVFLDDVRVVAIGTAAAPATLTSLDPPVATTGGPAFTLTVNGANFCSGSTVKWADAALFTTFVSTSQLTALVPASNIVIAGNSFVKVTNPAGVAGCAAGDSNQLSFLVKLPGPTITSLSPTSAATGGPAFTLTVNGSGFCSSSTLLWDDAPVTATFVSASKLTASIASSRIANPGTPFIKVSNPMAFQCLQGDSNQISFPIKTPDPSITTIAPATVFAGSAAFTLTINGADFCRASDIVLHGPGTSAPVLATLGTTYVSSARLTAQVTAAQIASAQTLQVSVSNGNGCPEGSFSPNRNSSNLVTLTVAPLLPTVTSLVTVPQPPVALTQFTLTVNGANFDPASVQVVISGGTCAANCLFTNSQLTTKTALQITLPVTLDAGTYTVAARNGAAGTPSSSVTLIVTAQTAQTPFLSDVTVTPGGAPGVPDTMILTGGGFDPATVQVDVAGISGVNAPGYLMTNAQLTTKTSTKIVAPVPLKTGQGGLYWISVHNGPNGTQSGHIQLVLSGPSAAPPVPTILTDGTGVINGATYRSGDIVSGSWVSLKGTGFTSRTVDWGGEDFSSGRLPTTLFGVQVLFNGRPGAVWYLIDGSPQQINVQAPDNLTGPVTVQVVRDGVAGNTVTANAVASAPGLFPYSVDGGVTFYPAAVFQNGNVLGDPSAAPGTRQARAGDRVSLYTNSLAVSPAGLVSVSGTFAPVTVTIGTVSFLADFAGLVGPGTFQINLTVPDLGATGNYPITVSIGGNTSQPNIRFAFAK